MINSLLVLNAGSSSIKLSLFAIEDVSLKLVVHGQITSLDEDPHFYLNDVDNTNLHDEYYFNESKYIKTAHAQALTKIFQWIKANLSQYKILAVGHRVVHGGDLFTQPVQVNEAVVQQLEHYSVLAPLHQPYNLSAISFLLKQNYELYQVACFDTSFHYNQSIIAKTYALPENIASIPIKRYGFHGISYEYIASVLPDYIGKNAAKGRIIIAHLGHGASLCALKNRQSIATTMGFTPLEGLPMGTRCGSIDPGILLYLLTVKNMNVETLSELLYFRSGLLGLSGISGDIRILLNSNNANAKLAIDHFVYSVNREIGSMVAVLGGLDGLVFTAGIGENSSEIREMICEHASWLGIKLNYSANNQGDSCISLPMSAVSIFVIPTNEELMIAKHTLRLFKEFKRG